MKQLHLIGTTGNNLCLVQIPTSWSQQEAKEMLERALLVFMKEKDNPEFLSSLNEEELKHQFPRFEVNRTSFCFTSRCRYTNIYRRRSYMASRSTELLIT